MAQGFVTFGHGFSLTLGAVGQTIGFCCIFSIIRGGFYGAFQEAPSGTCWALEAINSGSVGGAPLTRSQMYS